MAIYDQAQVNGGSNFEYPKQRCVLKQVLDNTLKIKKLYMRNEIIYKNIEPISFYKISASLNL